jgi:hypothetical protein
LQEVYGIRNDIRIVNLSLLNTAWYIKQLRDEAPKVPIGLSDRTIDNVQPIPWPKKGEKRFIPIPEDVVDSLKQTLPPSEAAKVKDRITFNLEPTISAGGGTGLRVQDLMVLRILIEAAWKRPVYFAVTVASDNMVGLDKYFRMDGLAFKVMPYPPADNDAEILRRNLVEKFQYRNLNNPDVYYNRNILKLLQNYRSAFIQLGSQYLHQGEKEKAQEVLEHMELSMPEKVIPFSDERAAIAVADLYRRLGQDVNLEERIKNVISGRSLSREDKFRLVYYYSDYFHDPKRAEELLLEMLNKNPSDVDVYSELFRVYKNSKQYTKAIDILEKWLRDVNPNDKQAQKELEEIRRLAADSTGAE